MPDPVPNPELLRSLGHLVRGLSALFWGLPFALVVCVETGRTDWFRTFGIMPPLIVTGLLFYGLWLIGDFQKQERPWRNALDRAKLSALVNFGLSPFLYWWGRLPDNPFFAIAVGVLMLSSLLFLFNLNFVLLRLGAMLPDETLRHETRLFTALNRNLLVALLGLIAAFLVLSQISDLPAWLDRTLFWFYRNSLLVLIVFALLPLAMTMALIWKTKEVILESVFGAK